MDFRFDEAPSASPIVGGGETVIVPTPEQQTPTQADDVDAVSQTPSRRATREQGAPTQGDDQILVVRDEADRQTPASVKDPEEYHDGMTK